MRLSPHPFTLRQLQYLVAVAEQRSFRKAADLCHVAQPSLSAQIAGMEGALGVTFFERGPRQVRVTEAGEQVVARARRLLAEAEELLQACGGLGDPFRGAWRLGIIPTVAPYLLPELSRHLRQAFPELAVQWSEDRTAQLTALLDRGELDGALLALESDISGLEHAVIGEDPFVLALPKAHPLSRRRGPVPARLLEDESVLLLEDGHCFRDQALRICAQSGAQELAFRATSLSTLAQMTAQGTGVTLLPRLSLGVENRQGELAILRLGEPEPYRTLALCWRPRAPLARAMAEMAARMQACFRACCAVEAIS